MKQFSLIGILLLAMGGCGVHVGNGMKGFQSDYGFQFQYSENLNFNMSTDGRTITLDNKDLVVKKDPDAPVSTLEINVKRVQGVETVDDVRRYAEQVHRGEALDFEEAQFPDAVGVRFFSENTISFQSVAFFYTKVQAMVQVSVKAYVEGNGVGLMRDALGSLSGSGSYGAPENVWDRQEEEDLSFFTVPYRSH